MRKFTFYLLALPFFFTVNEANAQLFKSKKKKAQMEAEAKKKAEAAKPKGFDAIIPKSAKTSQGLFTLHQVNDKFFYQIPDSLLGKEMLMVTRISKTASGIGFGGEEANNQVIRWEKKDKKILVRMVSHRVIASDSLPIYEAVINSNVEPILASFDIKTRGKDSISSVIEINELFDKDVKPFGLTERYRKQFKVGGIDPKRSFIERIKTFPKNVEVRSIKTYYASEAPAHTSRIAGIITLEINNSMILLPENPMKRRYFDERVGWFTSQQTDYGLPVQKTKSVTYLDRWRLEVKDEDIEKFKRGELVEPKKPIVYYVDRATPKEWIPYIKQGIEDWQKAFEEAGFKNAIIAKDPPTKEEDPDWDPDDMRYSVVRYLASPIPNANGPHISDPRTGEILNANINWYHNVMTLLRNWFFVQTAAINPDAQKPEFKTEIMGRLIRFVSSHEVGHTLGLPHNMGSSSAYPVDSLRSASFTKKHGTAPSIMDYARFNYIAQPEDKGVALMPEIGIYDKYSIAWGYRPILDKSAEEEKETLNQWILKHAGDPLYRFGHQQVNHIVDPSSQSEDLGDDAMKASTYGIANLKRIVPNLIKWTSKEGETYNDLKDLYAQVLGQYRLYIGHVAANVGGVYEHYKTTDQAGEVYVYVPKEIQKRAVQFLNNEVFKTPSWLINPSIIKRIEYEGTLERIKNTQSAGLSHLLNIARLHRVVENEALHGEKAYKITELMNDIRKGVWTELTTGSKIDAYRRNLQRAHVELLGNILLETKPLPSAPASPYYKGTRANAHTSDIKAAVRAELSQIRSMARSAASADAMTKNHLKDIAARIDKLFETK
ncbi:zinc-dependent metalloprotease [Capnocytophaga sp.]|uniref:zinc-dependent metalloprotease n=1 Tax=Capnocytophaga sp. TaxID=44737 RepID=UPI0026DC8CF8|nr:zinc-dependent metalloprotease [Capnocytophaga sp.]MDO5104418.1 zinc-dependent metalloprotease [Capnocytophaga sp.]